MRWLAGFIGGFTGGFIAGFMGLALASLSTDALAADACSVRSGAQIVPLVELYTSEGCSSCPPADRWLSRELGSGEHRANWLAFHVDYWDELGWPDRFASPHYSRRQRERVHAVGQSAVYTPQVMIGTQVQTVWRAAPAVARALNAATGDAEVGLALRLQPQIEGNTVHLGAARNGDTSGQAVSVWLAQTIDGQTSPVRAGENKGATLRHDRVVTRLWGPWPLASAPLAKAVEVELGHDAWSLTAFVQDASGKVLQSLRLAPSDCR